MQITIEHVNKNYAKQRGIFNISLKLPDQCLTAIVGPSGCGKTTLLRSIAGFLKVDSGQILFGGKDVTDLEPQARGAAMVFQNYALWPHMSVFDNVAYGLKLRNVPRKEREERVYDVMRRVEIDVSDIKKRKPSQYSGGQQQRIALARSLVIQPEVLLLDEPLSNLDAKVRQRLRVEIRSIQQSFGITAVYVTHDQEEALSMADFVVVMKDGRIEQAGTPEEVYRSPASYFVAHFLGESNTLDVKIGGQHQRLVVRSEDPKLVPVERVTPVERAIQAEAAAPLVGTIPPAAADLTSVSSFAVSPSSLPEVKTNGDQFILTGTVKEHLFVGSKYRHVVDIGGQMLFLDMDAPASPGRYEIRIPLSRAFRFAPGEVGTA
ncbi:ABC transporter ATP-binding protein [Ferviditalea candida]|uniref:ABC transporter ATP-binding protein n=1 Tax=Ferviditalea candida TaxID=3108399 RepID=A0ABU5ZEC5_9BACL|nr:ABC transporter ATP-binding protein [Paenibacillaceae bacterium T2]